MAQTGRISSRAPKTIQLWLLGLVVGLALFALAILAPRFGTWYGNRDAETMGESVRVLVGVIRQTETGSFSIDVDVVNAGMYMIANSDSAEVQATLGQYVGKHVQAYGTVNERDGTMTLSWILDEPTSETDSSSQTSDLESVLATWTQQEQTCIRDAMTSDEFKTLITASDVDLSETQLSAMNSCLSSIKQQETAQ